jgi:MFS family permease
MLAAQQIHATRGRWYILLLISLMYLITYLDRVNISTAAPVISKEFGFDKITMGAIFSAFVWAYALFQVPGGWLGDRLGPRRILTAIVTYWSVMTAATAMAGSAVSFIVVRFLFGIGEAGAFPVATRAMQLWYPREERGFVQGITHSASRAGAAIAPPIVVAIMSTLGWQWVFYICGAVGLVWAAWWYFSYRDLPEDHPMVNQIELQRIRGLDQAGNINQPTTEAKASVPWATLLRSPNMWAIMCAYFTYVYCLWIFLSWLPSYLVEFRHFTVAPAMGGRDRRYRRRARHRLVAEEDRQCQARATYRCHRRHAGLLRLHSAGGADGRCLYCRLLLDSGAVFSRVHHRAFLGGADGRRRKIFRDCVRHDEHGRQHRRCIVALGVWFPGAVRKLAGAIHCGCQPPRARLGGVGLLARSRRIGTRGAAAAGDSASCGRMRADQLSVLLSPSPAPLPRRWPVHSLATPAARRPTATSEASLRQPIASPI